MDPTQVRSEIDDFDPKINDFANFHREWLEKHAQNAPATCLSKLNNRYVPVPGKSKLGTGPQYEVRRDAW